MNNPGLTGFDEFSKKPRENNNQRKVNKKQYSKRFQKELSESKTRHIFRCFTLFLLIFVPISSPRINIITYLCFG